MRRFLKGLGVVASLVAVGIASAFAVVALLLHPENVRVPNLVGQDIVTVIELVRQQGLQLKVDRREPHPTLPRDTVISQDPAPGSGIRKGRWVRVVVSQGPSDLLAPNLTGENYRKADIMARQAGYIPGDVSRVSSDSVERDIVIAQYPQAGTPLEKGGAIGLLVSAGKKPTVYVMPKLTGKSPEEAVKIIDRLGLAHRQTARTPADKPQPGGRLVISQKPPAGYPVSADAVVNIVVNK